MAQQLTYLPGAEVVGGRGGWSQDLAAPEGVWTNPWSNTALRPQRLDQTQSGSLTGLEGLEFSDFQSINPSWWSLNTAGGPRYLVNLAGTGGAGSTEINPYLDLGTKVGYVPTDVAQNLFGLPASELALLPEGYTPNFLTMEHEPGSEDAGFWEGLKDMGNYFKVLATFAAAGAGGAALGGMGAGTGAGLGTSASGLGTGLTAGGGGVGLTAGGGLGLTAPGTLGGAFAAESLAAPALAGGLGTGLSLGAGGVTGLTPGAAGVTGLTAPASFGPAFASETLGGVGGLGGVGSLPGVGAPVEERGFELTGLGTSEGFSPMRALGELAMTYSNPVNAFSALMGEGANLAPRALGGLSSWLNTGSSIYGLIEAERQKKLARLAAERADPFASQRGGYASRLSALEADPWSITKTPGYEFGLGQGLQAIQRRMAASGYSGSGNEAIALQQYGQDYALQQLNAERARLAELAGAGFNPATAQALLLQGTGSATELQRRALAGLGSSVGLMGF